MATHSSTLAWKIPPEVPGKLQSLWLQSRTQLSDFIYLLTKYLLCIFPIVTLYLTGISQF